MSKVYLVLSGDGHDPQVETIFSTLEKANAYLRDTHDQRPEITRDSFPEDPPRVLEIEVDPEHGGRIVSVNHTEAECGPYPYLGRGWKRDKP